MHVYVLYKEATVVAHLLSLMSTPLSEAIGVDSSVRTGHDQVCHICICLTLTIPTEYISLKFNGKPYGKAQSRNQSAPCTF